MSIREMIQFFQQHGIPMMALVFFCEYLNMPGLPAGIIMPAVGILVAQTEHNIIFAIIISIISGVAGSVVMYEICLFGGLPILKKIFSKNKKFISIIEQGQKRLENGKGRAMIICRIIPMLRTIISIPAGILKMPRKEYIIYSTIGITIWNTILICCGYFFSEFFLNNINLIF